MPHEGIPHVEDEGGVRQFPETPEIVPEGESAAQRAKPRFTAPEPPAPEGPRFTPETTPAEPTVAPALPAEVTPLQAKTNDLMRILNQQSTAGLKLDVFNDIMNIKKPPAPSDLGDPPRIMGNEIKGQKSANGVYTFDGERWLADPQRAEEVAGAYRKEMNEWRNISLAAMKLQLDMQTAESDKLMAALQAAVSLEVSEAGRKAQASESALQRQHQVEQARQKVTDDRETNRILHDNAVKIVEATRDANIAFSNNEQDRIDRRADLDRAIAHGNLTELVRNNKELNRLDGERVRLEEQRDKWDFLGKMLSSGGLGFFTLAMIDPAAARTLFSQLAPGGTGDLAGPFAAAAKYRGQISGGGLEIPSAQQVAQGSPTELLFQQEAFAGQGRSLAAEVENITPETPGQVVRRRA